MNSYERVLAAFEHREGDRIPMQDTPWQGTLNRWHREGMPQDVDWARHFGFDRFGYLNFDTSPRYEAKVIGETDTHITKTTSWGVTLRYIKEVDSTPEFLNFTVTDPDSWREAKARMTPSKDRINWARLDADYKACRRDGGWVQANFWFGFDITHSWFVGTETLLMALVEEPEWCAEMFNTELDMCIAQAQMVLDAGYKIDSIRWPDDMGYKHNQFFSLNTYRELLKPVHKRACDWAHERGIKVHLHSCGDINPFIPELIDIGIDMLNPLEVKAGMDPVHIKQTYGDKLALHGGINAVLYENPELIVEEIKRLVPILKQGGGYMFSSDHSIPNNVTYSEMKAVTAAVMEAGRF